MKRKYAMGLLLAGACSACWVIPAVIAAGAAGWIGTVEPGVGIGALVAIPAAAAAFALTRMARGRRCDSCCSLDEQPPAT